MGQLISYTSPIGGDQGLIIEPNPAVVFSSIGTVVQNAALMVKFRLSKPALISKIAIFVGTAAGNLDVGVYSLIGSTYTMLGHSGATAAAGTNAIQELTMLANISLAPGIDYWATFASDSATVQILRQSMGAAAAGGYSGAILTKTSHYSSGLSNITAPATNTVAPWFALTSAV